MATLLDYALTTVADVKESLGIASGDNSQNNLIIRKINQATLIIEGYCNLPYGHHFKESTYTNEVYNSNGTNQLPLLMWPVSSVSSFQYANTSQNNNSWTDNESEDYFVDENSGLLNLNFSQWGNWDAYRVTYTAGFSTIPADLAEACVMLAGYLVDNSASGTAVKRKREGGREVEYFQPSGQSSTGTSSLVDQLGLDEVLGRYIHYAVADR